MRKDVEQEYIKRIQQVLDFIEENLDAKLSLELLSQKAHYSAYHFHRLFATVVDENLNEYINRKRIERIASIILVDSKRPIKELAFTYGFNSDSSFSRSFKKYYGVSPTQFKTKGKEILSKIGIEVFSTEKYICSIDNLKKWIDMNAQITVKELQEIPLAGIMHIGEFEKIGGFYQQLIEWGHKKEVLSTSNFRAITMYHDNPNVTQLSKVRYSACVTIDKPIKAEGKIRPLSIQKGVYAVGNFILNTDEFPKAWKNLSMWVLENDCEFRDGTYFEVYLNDHKTHPEQKFIIEICIPIEKPKKTIKSSSTLDISNYKNSPIVDSEKLDYHELIAYMKKIRAYFLAEYETEFTFGSIYQGNKDYSYFSLTSEDLKRLKLKFVIIFDHVHLCFKICLSGQNKDVRKKYWNLFHESNWSKYTLATSISESLSIMDHVIVKEASFDNMNSLIEEIEQVSFKFMHELRAILEF